MNTEIRKLLEGDAVPYASFRTDPQIYGPYIEDGVEMDRRIAFLVELREQFYFKIWGCFVNDDLVAVWRLHRQGLCHWEVFLAAVPEFRGKQMEQWTKQVMTMARREFGDSRIILEARVNGWNRASIAFIKRFGFAKTGIIPISCFKNGRLWPKWIYSRELV